MIEVMIAAIVLVVAVGGLSSSVVSAMRLNQVNEETARAHDIARAMAGNIQATPFNEIWRTFNADDSDDPGGVGTATGPNFAVAALPTQEGDQDGMVGQIVFPGVAVGGGDLELREDFVDAALGMPRDLNGDGVQDQLDHTDDYIVLPVTIRLEWRGSTGDRVYELNLLLVE